ncbi:ubiquinone/menaquinone biosynthesis C-methylase UbiE [Dinghuibacter silviterrae]|uniref:Ubiquinone/menaquinone biosynthesis C-methylase UbiE n=2 Tax=Dinghuibacter silviterrae TaxID=1539049 RepID=A0A4R8DSI6_9BACT|nr:ubiquinone/menaquinone biosynthesis C-methylase UbiE [Dinghuibacter silviterrae]
MKFDGSIAKSYDHHLGAFLFEPYATDLVGRIGVTGVSNILELACGTGIVTRHLIDRLFLTVELTATDINEEMLAIAQGKILAPNISWDAIDMSAIPYDDDLFDVVVCQFGLMFVPDKIKAVKEMHRVLKKGGKLLFNVWGNIADNPIWRIYSTVIKDFFPNAAQLTGPGPFSMSDEKKVLALLNEAGFTDHTVDAVQKTGVCETAAGAAEGFVLGTPLYHFIIKTDPLLLEKFQNTLEKAIISELGDLPARSPLHAWVFSAKK